MPVGDIETFHENAQGRNRLEGECILDITCGGLAETFSEGRRVAQGRNVERIIHTKDGTIGERNSCGHDPCGRKPARHV
jgi:hypothetical protein